MNRIVPALGAAGYQTFSIAAPVATHTRPATCDEAGCLPHRNGWTTTVDEATALGQQQAAYIRGQAGRGFTETTEAGMTVFRFAAGQTCFAAGSHRVPLDRPALYSVRGGDWRGNPAGLPTRTHTRAEHWVEDFAEHLDRVEHDRS
jgi:hypothetical protein